jgi:hypothetical protein
MSEEIPEVLDKPAEEVPVPVTDPPEDPPEHHESDRPDWVDEIIGAINSVKEASPITPVEDEVLDKSPVRPPWTHRKPFSKRD